MVFKFSEISVLFSSDRSFVQINVAFVCEFHEQCLSLGMKEEDSNVGPSSVNAVKFNLLGGVGEEELQVGGFGFFVCLLLFFPQKPKFSHHASFPLYHLISKCHFCLPLDHFLPMNCCFAYTASSSFIFKFLLLPQVLNLTSFSI